MIIRGSHEEADYNRSYGDSTSSYSDFTTSMKQSLYVSASNSAHCVNQPTFVLHRGFTARWMYGSKLSVGAAVNRLYFSVSLKFPPPPMTDNHDDH